MFDDYVSGNNQADDDDDNGDYFFSGVKIQENVGDVSAADCDEVQPFESVKRHNRKGNHNSWPLAHF